MEFGIIVMLILIALNLVKIATALDKNNELKAKYPDLDIQ